MKRSTSVQDRLGLGPSLRQGHWSWGPVLRISSIILRSPLTCITLVEPTRANGTVSHLISRQMEIMTQGGFDLRPTFIPGMLKHADSWDTRISGCPGKLGSKFHGCSSEETELSVQCGSECVALLGVLALAE